MVKNLLTWAEFGRFLKFALVGVLGLVVNTAFLYLLTTYVFGEALYMLSAAISLELSILNNFYFNERWTFRDRSFSDALFGRLVKFHVSRILGAVTTLTALYLLTEHLKIYYLLSNIVGVGFGTLVNYLTSRFWVWG